MLILAIIRSAFRSLYSSKLRTFLATLGVIIGVGAVIAMLALAAGVREKLLASAEAMGTNLLGIRSSWRGGRGGGGDRNVQNLTIKDAEFLAQRLQGYEMISLSAGGDATCVYLNRNDRTQLNGISFDYFASRNYKVEKGRGFTEAEITRGSRVCVLGPHVAENLFGRADPVGEYIRLNRMTFRVIGVTKLKGDQGWFNPDDQVFVPLKIAMEQIIGTENLREINVVVAKNADRVEVEAEIMQLMRQAHRLQPGQPDTFSIRNVAEAVEQAEQVTKTFSFLLGGIAGISLLVGGIGIMNVMLVTVTERTREIGIRKAVGARPRDILRQFLLESVIMSGTGGLLGVGLGYVASEVISRFSPDYTPIVQLDAVFISLAFSVVVGVFFGYYPARKAALLSPVETLRHE